VTTPPRRRDAARTRRLLLEAARRRFGEDGYAATTVRDIADDAGVNVALINRYFASKEGLFEACLTTAGEDLRRTTGEVTLDQVAATIAGHIAGSGAPSMTGQLALLLRSSGDERADRIRIETLQASARRLAELADGEERPRAELAGGEELPRAEFADGEERPRAEPGGGEELPRAEPGGELPRAAPGGGEELLLRAEVVLAATIGIALLRASTRIEPLASATESDLAGTLADLVEALLGSPRT
jgi:AcrR family transcriptional regulator